jgi:hypothetical protein
LTLIGTTQPKNQSLCRCPAGSGIGIRTTECPLWVESGHSSRYAQRVKQDPVYLRNQSRALHRLYRRNRRFLKGSVILWLVSFTALALAGTIDHLFGLGWGFSPHEVLVFVGFMVFGGVFWILVTLIAKINLRYIRHTYGPDPSDNNEARR